MFAAFSKDRNVSNLVMRAGLAVVTLSVFAGAAMADRRDDTRRELVRGSDRHDNRGDRNDNHGGWDRGRDRDRDRDSRVSFSLSIGNDWRRGAYCPPPVVIAPRYCHPPVVIAPCPPPVIIRDRCDDYGYRPRPVFVEHSVYVDRPVYVERQVVVERPVVIERPVVVERPVVIERQVVVQPEPRVDPEAGRYQDRELGDSYLRTSDFENASRVYRRYLAAWDADGTVNRNFGLAALGRGDVQEGFRAVVRGYTLEPSLFQRSLRTQDLGGPYGVQSLLDAASRGASGTNTAEGWFTVAVLQHAAGNRESATQASQRARDAGLNTSLLDSLTLMLNRQAS